MNVFLDSSALVKRYLEEKGSAAVEQICVKASHIIVSIVALPEVFSALNRKKREQVVSQQQYEIIKRALFSECEEFLTCPLSPAVIKLSIDFTEKFPLRAMDALHLACAVDFNAELFVSSDERQVNAARDLKLKVMQV